MQSPTLATTEHQNKLRVAKTTTVGIRVTEPEYLALQQEAEGRNQTVSEWARQKILGDSASPDVLSKHIFTELVGLQLLLMNTLSPLLRGEHMSAEKVEAVKRHVQAIKRAKAEELLARRANEATPNCVEVPSVRTQGGALPLRRSPRDLREL